MHRVIVHADESCLGNGAEGSNPGGSASLLELRSKGQIVRRDLYISAPATTNNRMALAGAIATFALLSKRGKRLQVVFVSDSQYLVRGITEWVPGWRARGWRRKGGRVENLELWRKLVDVVEPHEVTWIWVRGHAGHAKNEYVNDLAIRAATEQRHSDAVVDSDFDEWLAVKKARGLFPDYDADKALEKLAAQVWKS